MSGKVRQTLVISGSYEVLLDTKEEEEIYHHGIHAHAGTWQ
jgi:hypothetical protein